MEIKIDRNTKIKIEVEATTEEATLSKVVLYNDDWHTFDEVITQLIKATRCTFEEARNFAFEVHVKGRATVFFGELTKCFKVSTILQEIALHTEVVS
ncbi:MAG: Clp protease ClpS [Chlorobiaceae bacterium]|nr:Clp protease ClpS [Chlorobiaceae bacterium]MBA4309712.1 Clp protease ClpS [Chlorobiaceae bacterium]